MNGGGGEAGMKRNLLLPANPPYMVYLPGVQDFSPVPHMINDIFLFIDILHDHVRSPYVFLHIIKYLFTGNIIKRLVINQCVNNIF